MEEGRRRRWWGRKGTSEARRDGDEMGVEGGLKIC